ncbi:MAG TPA: class I SAM-dependent methyltransferase [Dongiaceae bacterium]|nr:class I SAM-dependent methyltransferase [Dongiaceae bacterium]
MANFKIRLTPHNLSRLVWDQWISNIEPELDAAKTTLKSMSDACESIRGRMDYNTGSISFASSLLLYIATRNLQPKVVFEVGTFIGKSILSIALATDRNDNNAEIFTCDGSNDFAVPTLSKTRINGFPKTTSTDALLQLAAAGKKLDFVHLDGRLAAEDLGLLQRICDPRAVLAIDDFEGMEKGVANLSVLRSGQAPFFSQHILVYPAMDEVLQRLGVLSRTTTAFFLPFAALTYTNQ